MEPADLSDAIDFAAQLHRLYVERSAAYRGEYINVIIFYLSGTAAILAFWLTTRTRRYLFPVFVFFFAASSSLAVTIQLYWYQYNHTTWRLSEEYRQQAMKLLNGSDSSQFNDIDCKMTSELSAYYNIAENNAPESIKVGWDIRKHWEVNRHWNKDTVKVDDSLSNVEKGHVIACTPSSARLLTARQGNIWTFLVVLAGVGAILITLRTRHGPNDPAEDRRA